MRAVGFGDHDRRIVSLRGCYRSLAMASDEDGDEAKTWGELLQTPPLPWPGASHGLTKPGPTWALSANFGWSKGSPVSRIMGYREAAQVVFEQIQSDRSGRDTLIFPLAFLWRHAIELQLKWIVARGQVVVDEAAEYPKTHNVQKLWAMAQVVIAELNEPDHGEIENTTRIIDELSALDPEATGFRYHEDKKGQPSLTTTPDSLDVGQVHEALSGVSQFLDGVSDVLENAIDYMNQSY